MGVSKDSRKQKERCHNTDNKSVVKITAQILRATEAMALHVRIVKKKRLSERMSLESGLVKGGETNEINT